MKEGQVINSLMELPQFEPEERFVHLPRLNVVFQLRELTYNQLMNLVQDPDREIQLILKATINHPELKDFNWYHDKMGCATPVDALKKLLRKQLKTKKIILPIIVHIAYKSLCAFFILYR